MVVVVVGWRQRRREKRGWNRRDRTQAGTHPSASWAGRQAGDRYQAKAAFDMASLSLCLLQALFSLHLSSLLGGTLHTQPNGRNKNTNTWQLCIL